MLMLEMPVPSQGHYGFQFSTDVLQESCKSWEVDARPEKKDNSGRDWTSMSRSQKIHKQGRSTSQPTNQHCKDLSVLVCLWQVVGFFYSFDTDILSTDNCIFR
jgi:hypothetical protein